MSIQESFFGQIHSLRKHILRSFYYIIVSSGLSFWFMDEIIVYLKSSYQKFLSSAKNTTIASQMIDNLSTVNVFEVMVINLKISFIVGCLIALPLVIFEIWRFVSPALYKQERVLLKIILILSLIFFYFGILFGYFLIIPFFFQNALSLASQYAKVMITYESYFNTLTVMVFIFGIIFEVPIILSLLGISGILTSSTIEKNRRIVFLGSFIIGALLAPPDVFSMCLIAIPLYLMVEISILFVRFFENKKELTRK